MKKMIIIILILFSGCTKICITSCLNTVDNINEKIIKACGEACNK